jgi:hypothetical protein
MFKKIDIYKRLEPIVNAMDKSVICQSVSDNSDGTFTFLCNYTKWLTPGYDVTIGLENYTIIDFSPNVSFTVSGSILPTQLTFDLYAFKFTHGTIVKVAEELTAELSYKNKYPLIVLREILDEKIHLEDIDSIDSDAECNLFFLTDCVFENWTQADGDNKGLKPMRAAVNEFLKALSQASTVGELLGLGTVKGFNIFGNTDQNGVTRNIFNDFLCGYTLKINIPFLRDCDCCDALPIDTRPAPGYVYDVNGDLLAVLYSNEIYISTGGGGACLPVTVKDKITGATITTVVSGGEYEVTQLREIEDTINNNELEIINPII